MERNSDLHEAEGNPLTTDELSLPEIDPKKIENPVLSAAITRIKERSTLETRADYYTKHTSHSRYSKGW